MKIALAANFKKTLAKELAHEVARFLEQKGVEVCGPKSDLAEGIEQDVDFVISFGGDGTILALIHKNPTLEAPIIGVNIGTLGFLADITPANLYKSLESILEGNYSIQERLMLEGTAGDGSQCLAVNELVVHRGSNYNLVDIGLTVNGKYLNTFSADGVIVATPSGSTAYSLSAGGPIVSPELEAVVITPICPHALTNRPIVLQQPDVIEIAYLSDYLPVEVAFDGMCRFSLDPKEVFTIKPAKKRFRLVSVPGFDYFATLRGKLNWAGSLKT